MGDARAQWNELLQSSLDSSVQRLIEQITQRSQDVLREEESKIREHVAEARQPLTQISSEARETLARNQGVTRSGGCAGARVLVRD